MGLMDVCPADKKRKPEIVCTHRRFVDGVWQACEHFVRGCKHPGKYKKA